MKKESADNLRMNEIDEHYNIGLLTCRSISSLSQYVFTTKFVKEDGDNSLMVVESFPNKYLQNSQMNSM